MPSPFPGMNPYLEQDSLWHDFHERFSPAAAAHLTAQVRPNYIVRIDEQIYIHEPPEDSHRLLGRADIGLAELTHGDETARDGMEMPTAVAVFLPAVDIERESFIEIRDRESRTLVTVIELLSPSNKFAGPDREQYLVKRHKLLNSLVHVVELDLLRGGPRLPVDGLPKCDYCALVSRAELRPKALVLPFSLRDPLPVVPIPLRDGASAQLHLKDLLDRIYDDAGYEDYIYLRPPQPRLATEDAEWTRQLLRERGLLAKG